MPGAERSTVIDRGSSDSSKARGGQEKREISVPQSLAVCPYREGFVQQLEFQTQRAVQ